MPQVSLYIAIHLKLVALVVLAIAMEHKKMVSHPIHTPIAINAEVARGEEGERVTMFSFSTAIIAQ